MIDLKDEEIMKFNINKDVWRICLAEKDNLLEIYKQKYNEESTFCFGLCKFDDHKIVINRNMNKDQQIKTLMHELTHCYIFNYGLYNVPNFNEEMVCDLVSGIYYIIEEIVKEFKELI